jgi:hypothetical protein
MFVAQDLTIGTRSRAAQARLVNLLHGTGWPKRPGPLTADRSPACSGWGPARLLAAKLVRVSFLDPVYRDDVMTVGLRWEATGAAGALFPVLDANISISPAGDEAAGWRWRAPTGFDRGAMRRVVATTMRSLLRNLADALATPAAVGQSAEDTSPGMRPVAESGMP